MKHGYVIRRTGNRFHNFFSNIEGNADRATESIVRAGASVEKTSETVNQAVSRLSRTLNESIVILRDELAETFVEIRGMGRDVAAAIRKGIKEERFKPTANVKANVFAAVPICNVM